MRFRFAAAALLFVASSASAVYLGPERRVLPPGVHEASGDQRDGAIASSGSESLVVYADADRAGLYGAIVGSDGSTSAPRRIHDGMPHGMSVCWTGASYLVTWYDQTQMFAAAVSRDGVPGEAHKIDDVNFTAARALAWNGQHAFVTYNSKSFASRAALLDAQGNPLRTNIPIPNLNANVVSAAGSTFYVFQIAQGQPIQGVVKQTLLATRFGDDGTQLDNAPVGLATIDPVNQNLFDVAFDGSRFAFAGMKYAPPTSLERILIDAQTLTAQVLPAVPASSPSGMAVTWNGSAFVAVWADYDTPPFSVKALPFNGASDANVNTVIANSGMATDLVASSSGGRVVALWNDRGFNGEISDVRAAILDGASAQTAVGPFDVSTAVTPQRGPAIAPGITAWSEPVTDVSSDVFAEVNGVRILLSDGAEPGVGTSVGVVATGKAYLVVWQQGTTPALKAVRMRRLRLDGTLMDAAPLSVAEGWQPSIACNGSIALLAFQQGGDTLATQSGTVYTLRFDRDGNRLDGPALQLSSGDEPAVASDGSGFFVAWRVLMMSQGGGEAPILIYWHMLSGARFTAAGVVRDTPALSIANAALSAPVTDIWIPAVAFGGGHYVVGYFTYQGGNVAATANAILPNGAIGAPIQLYGGAPIANDRAMAAGADATGVWFAISTYGATLHLVHVGATGVAVEQETIAGATAPAFAPGSLAYSRAIDPDHTFVFVRTLSPTMRSHAAGR